MTKNSSGENHPVLQQPVKAVDEKAGAVTGLSEYAKAFASDDEGLGNAPLDEINKTHMKLAQSLTQVRAIREDLEREHASVEGQCATYREIAIRGPTR